jgi:hypothetical protein
MPHTKLKIRSIQQGFSRVTPLMWMWMLITTETCPKTSFQANGCPKGATSVVGFASTCFADPKSHPSLRGGLAQCGQTA